MGSDIKTSSNTKNRSKHFTQQEVLAAMYDPQIGRFLSVDPLLDAFPSHSPYSYSFNNPISYTDTTG